MFDHSKRPSRFSMFRRFWKPAFTTGAGGVAALFWLDEIMAFGQELLALLVLPIMAGALFLLDIFMFRTRMPRSEDIHGHNKNGVEK